MKNACKRTTAKTENERKILHKVETGQNNNNQKTKTKTNPQQKLLRFLIALLKVLVILGN